MDSNQNVWNEALSGRSADIIRGLLLTLFCRSLQSRFGRVSLKKILPLLATFVVATFPASAGGPGWLVEIVSIERVDSSHAVLKLRNASDQIHEPFQVCNPLVVTADYDGEFWPKTWSEKVTENVHVEALDAVTKIQESGGTLMFGYIGTGLVHESVRLTCYVVARGLMFHPDEGLIAFHDKI